MNPRPTPLGAALTLVGAAFVAWGILAQPDRPAWAVWLGIAATVAWVLRTLAAMAGWRRVALVLTFFGAAAGAIAAAGTEGTAVVPAAVCISLLVSDESVPLPVSAGSALVALGLVAVGAVTHPVPVLSLIALLAAVVLGFLAGFSRRQIRRAQQREALLAEREIAVREEAARIAIARDLHDVLAHTLGGLVIQLDAADALLEAGDATSAHARVVSARELAGSGLGEARRAVAALRAPSGVHDEPDVIPGELRASLDDLVAAHRSLGGEVDFTTSGESSAVPADVAVALQRALQEALSNARRHAPGAPVTVGLVWSADAVALSVENPVTGAPASAAATQGRAATQGGGYGLVGMGERFAALALGGSVTTAEADGVFTLTAEARTGPRAPAPQPQPPIQGRSDA
ncbi:sensor histidine kinase [Microbacterium sp. ASV49]|uniref:histidine kinase n=1 Tax=Microbacterium candidum TaxID=3041922 RepID=A0ABT7MXJ7_9MICO|nr:histidine kinase [Microbacterium sp. ASV49]MDL9979160.1 histidine kinase [Microbacterium sp. ASV49]